MWLQKITAYTFLFLALFLLLAPYKPVSAIDVPGVNCGMAEGANGIDKCCFNPQRSLPNIPPSIPGADLLQFTGAMNSLRSTLGSVQQKTNSNISACSYGTPSGTPGSPGCVCQLATGAGKLDDLTDMCNKYVNSSPNALQACVNCTQSGGYPSAIGCIPLTLSNFIMNFALSLGIGLGGMYALWCIIYSSIKIQLSRGKAETIQKARENITSCIVGLMLIIFSVFILRVIGVNLLSLPGFS